MSEFHELLSRIVEGQKNVIIALNADRTDVPYMTKTMYTMCQTRHLGSRSTSKWTERQKGLTELDCTDSESQY